MKTNITTFAIVGAVALVGWSFLKPKAAAATGAVPGVDVAKRLGTTGPAIFQTGTAFHTALINGVSVNVPANPNSVLMEKPGNAPFWISNADVPAFLKGGWTVA